ncbi:hypothetical protein Goe20_01750 [Bacillus phage vB_BsuM-Goe20]|nr:hypothetical protein Goe20_01750 [Bacillus phage vB_BsuM-Goe20]
MDVLYTVHHVKVIRGKIKDKVIKKTTSFDVAKEAKKIYERLCPEDGFYIMGKVAK